VSRSAVKIVTLNRAFFSSYDIEHIMKPIRVISQAESIDKQLEKIDNSCFQLNKKYNEISSKYDTMNAKLSLLLEGLEELKSPKKK